MNLIKEIEGGCGPFDVAGFHAGSAACDIRETGKQRLDLGLLVSDVPCVAAGVFTQNRIAAAPVQLGREQLRKGGEFRAIVANSGNANACTGEQGMTDARAMRAAAARALGYADESVFVCSTGRIGRLLPMPKLLAGIEAAARNLSAERDAGLQCADAILTSDTRRKVVSVDIETSVGTIRIGGMAKGAGMIEPNMATMLAFITTDAEVGATDLQVGLQESVHSTFNAITVDGDQSTNDTVLVLANGLSNVAVSPAVGEVWDAFKAGLHHVCHRLAQMIVGDGEKISKVVELCIRGATTEAEARLAARAVGNSLLVKSSWYGNDPNWGRVLDAVGYSGAMVSEKSVAIGYGSLDGEAVPAFSGGKVFDANKAEWKRIVAASRFRIEVDLGMGNGHARMWATDLTEAYVDFNKSE